MPSDDLILDLRQIAGYPPAQTAQSSDAVVMQRGGLGGPYVEISPSLLVSTALSTGGDMSIGGNLNVQSIGSGSATFSNAAVGLLSAQNACVQNLSASAASILGVPVATTTYVDIAHAASVWSFEGRQGDVRLWIHDILRAGGAPIFSPAFGGTPRAPTPQASSNSTRLATTEFVQRNSVLYIDNLLANHPFVFTFNGRTGDIVLTPEDIGNVEGALLNSPALQGTPTAPTAPPLTNNTQLATTQYVDSAVSAASAIYAPINSPNFIGFASAQTAPPGTATGVLATTAFVMNAVADSVSGVATWNGRSGNVTMDGADIANAGGAVLDSPVFVGVPQAPTAAVGVNTNQVATCAWVLNEIGGANVGVMSFNGRSGAVVLNTSDITGAGGAPIVSPAFSGVPMAPTAATNTSTDQIATTAFVMGAVNEGSVASFNGRTGAVTLTANDVSAAGGLSNPSPNLTGTPTAPTQANASTSTTQVATTAFVQSAIAAGAVVSFNGRSGAISLTTTDITNAGGAVLNSPAFSGVPTAPTAVAGTSTTQLATCAFVTAAIAAASGAFLPLTGGTLTGDLIVNANGGSADLGGPTLYMSGSSSAVFASRQSGGASSVNFMTGGLGTANLRIAISLTDNETGGNAGGNLYVSRYSDTGTWLSSPLTIMRGTGMMIYSGPQTMAPDSSNFTVGPRNGSVGLQSGNGISWNASNGVICEMNTAGNVMSVNRNGGNGPAIVFYQGGTGCGSITVANANSTAFNTSSDVRLKEDERPFDAGPYLDDINVYDFRFRSGGPRRHGVMAQEVDTVYPEAVTHNDLEDWWGVDYSKFVPLLLQEVKSLRRRVAQLEAA